jgi:hypothetical protein
MKREEIDVPRNGSEIIDLRDMEQSPLQKQLRTTGAKAQSASEDDQFEHRRPLDREVARLGTSKELVNQSGVCKIVLEGDQIHLCVIYALNMGRAPSTS